MTRKTPFKIAILISVLPLTGFLLSACQQKDGLSRIPDAPDKFIAEKLTSDEASAIDAKVKAIKDGIKSYRKCENSILGLSTEGASLFSYYNGDALVELDVTFYGETGKSEKIIYFDKQNPAFMEELDTRYDIPMYMEGSKIESEILGQIYFKDSKIVAWNNDGKTIPPESEEYQIKAREWNESFNELKIQERINLKDCLADKG